jgi:hypothetical protein
MTGFMAREFFGSSALLMLPMVALAIFATTFVILALRVMIMKRPQVDARASLALEGDEGRKDHHV